MRRDLSDLAIAATSAVIRGFVYATLILPVVVVAGASVTQTSTLRFPPSGFTLDWYRAALDSQPFMESLRVSTLLALIVTALSMTVGGAVSFAISRRNFRGRRALEMLVLSPLIIPAVILGLGLLQVLAATGLGQSSLGLVVGHTVVALPYVVRTMVASLAMFDQSLEEAAMSLRARPATVLRKITLPLIAPGVISAMTFAFVASFGNVTLSVFLGFGGFVTLPVRILASIENQYDPILAAVSVLVVAVTIGLIIVSETLWRGTQVKSSSPSVVELRGVSKRFGTHVGVEDASFEMARGEILCLLGPSGCGKTTTLRAVAGFVRPEKGEILIGGAEVTHMPPYRRDIGIVFQNYALFPHMTVAQNIAFGLENVGMPVEERKARVLEMLALVELVGLADRKPRELSGGQQQRVALARALALRPAVLLLDEPFSNLDSQLRARMQLEVAALLRRISITTLLVTHDQAEAFTVADRVAVMRAGRIEQIGTPEEIYRAPASRFVAEFVGSCVLIEGIIRNGVFSGLSTLMFAAPAAPEGPALAVIRPEAVLADATAHAVTGKVVERTYLGSSTRMRILVEGDVVIVDEAGPGRFQVGQDITIAVDGSTVSFLPRVGASQ